MSLFSAFHLKLSRVYSLPTLRGLIMSAILAAAIVLSITRRSEVEQWIFLFMILLVFIHLLELNDSICSLKFSVLPFDLPFSGEEVSIPVRVESPKSFISNQIFFKVDQGRWTEFDLEHEHTFWISFSPKKGGVHAFPGLKIKVIGKSRLFQLWRTVETQEPLYALPPPIQHQVQPTRKSILPDHSKQSDLELSQLEPIRESRLMPKMDQKLFQKTSLPYFRFFENQTQKMHDSILLRWDDLKGLNFEHQGEQFSFWIQTVQRLARDPAIRVSVDTPFFKGESVHWRNLKRYFSQWYYEKK